MKKLLYCIVLINLYSASSCRKTDDIPKNTPGCIKEEIKRLTSPTSSSWAIGSVDEYIFQGNTVYAFAPTRNIADGSTLVKDANCNLVCTYGGYGGPSVLLCNGEKFSEKAVFKRTIWKE
jgi:hypothetical protein